MRIIYGVVSIHIKIGAGYWSKSPDLSCYPVRTIFGLVRPCHSLLPFRM